MRYKDKDLNYSIYTKCAVCGKGVFVPVVGMWTYKKIDSFAGSTVKYFCGWNCMRKYEKEHEEEKASRRQEQAKRQRKHQEIKTT